jgi:3-oxoacyl-[acyl-carrier-protein] synthase II
VAVTGLGAITALGKDLAHTFSRLTAGDCGFSEITEFDASCARIRSAAEIKGLRVSDVAPNGKAALWSRADSLAALASTEALTQARVGGRDLFLAIGGTSGGMREAEPVLMADAAIPCSARQAQQLLAYPLYSSAQRLSELFPTVRHSATFCSACSSSATAIIQAANWLTTGRCECVLAGGTDALSLLTLTGFTALGAMSDKPCRPFDAARSGMSLGEGAAFLVMESEDSARQRGADILAWIDGWSLGAEAHHITHPEPGGTMAAQLIQTAANHAGFELSDIGYFNAHGTGTIPNDSMEANALRSAFGSQVGNVWVSTVKGQLGHTLGAAGAIEAAITILALCEERLPPTMGLTTPAPDTILRHIIGNSISAKCQHALSSSFGFGGLGAVLAISHLDTPGAISPGRKKTLVISAMSGTTYASVDQSAIASDNDGRSPLALSRGTLESADPLTELEPDRSRRFDRLTALSCTGAKRALSRAGLDSAQVGLVVGNALGNVERLAGYLGRLSAKGPRGIPPAEFPHLVPSSVAGNASIYLGLSGPVATVSDKELCSDVAFDLACGCLQQGLVKAMLTGVVEAHDTGIERICDPFGCLPILCPTKREVSNWFVIEAEEQVRARDHQALAKVLDFWIGQGPWYQYLVQHEAPPLGTRLWLLGSGVQLAALDSLPSIGTWREARGVDLPTTPRTASGKSGVAMATAVDLIQRGIADQVVVISGARGKSAVLRLSRSEPPA